MNIPTGFQLGPIYIYYYGIILMVGALAGGWLASVEAKRRGYDPEIAWDGLIWVLIAGIIGARLWHILTPPQSMVEQGITTSWYFMHPLDILNTRQGGLGIPGAIIGGAIGLYLFCRRRKFNFLVFADMAVPGLALGQAIGRWGNFVNQELYGAPTNLPWALHIAPQNRLPGFQDFETYHPLFLYESLWNLANMGILLWLGRKYKEWLRAGDLLLIYLIIYPTGRFLLEFLRLDSAYIGGINANQTLMAVVAVASAAILFWRHRSATQPEAADIPEAAKNIPDGSSIEDTPPSNTET
jgi:phosphatidylglycerol:prolipoprotein diacylglycerol transferase